MLKRKSVKLILLISNHSLLLIMILILIINNYIVIIQGQTITKQYKQWQYHHNMIYVLKIILSVELTGECGDYFTII